MKRVILAVVAATVIALGGVAAVAADPGNGNGPPATVPGSPGDDCSHGNSDQACRPDPQPEHGKDCENHGQARGNEDHCAPGETTPTDTTPTDTTPTDTVPTTPEETTSTPTEPIVPASTPGPAPAPESSPTPGSAAKPTPRPTKKSAPPKPDAPKAAATTVVAVKQKANGVVVVTTADGRKHVGIMGSG